LKTKGVDRKDVTEKTGIAQANLSHYLNGQRTMSIFQAARLKKSYPDLDLNELIGGAVQLAYKPNQHKGSMVNEPDDKYQLKLEDLTKEIMILNQEKRRLESELLACQKKLLHRANA
jgi:transcriptional regulator with XRE-family HTH domain